LVEPKSWRRKPPAFLVLINDQRASILRKFKFVQVQVIRQTGASSKLRRYYPFSGEYGVFAVWGTCQIHLDCCRSDLDVFLSFTTCNLGSRVLLFANKEDTRVRFQPVH
jgi:hypothetical protein